MGEVFAGWEGSLLWKVEGTPGTPVTPDTAFGYVQNCTMSIDAALEDMGAIGTHLPVSLEEGVINCRCSMDYFPTTATAINIGQRSSGVLSSYSIHANGGDTGWTATGAKVNTIRGSIDAGGRLSISQEFLALAAQDAAEISAVLPTAETFSWCETVIGLAYEFSGVDWTINQNLTVVPCIAGSSTTMPVTGLNRTGYRIKEGRQASTELNLRFFTRPTQAVLADILTNIASLTIVSTGDDVGAPTLTWTFANGKPASKEMTVRFDAVTGWTMPLKFKTWVCA